MIDINEIEKAALANGLNVSDLLTPDEMASLSVEDTSVDHFDNLLSIPEIKDKAAGLASDVIRWLDNDEKGDRAKWIEQEKEALAALGLSDESKSERFEGASTAIHPFFIEAVEQIHNRLLTELRPANGNIVKVDIVSEQNPETIAQANRVEKYFNYLYGKEMPDEFGEMDALLFRLVISGSCFKEVMYCQRTNKMRALFIKPEDLIVPWSARDLKTSPRIIHRRYESHSEFQRNVASGYYAASDTTEAGMETISDIRKIELESEGRKQSNFYETNEHVILKCYCTLDIEDGYDYPMEYIVWIEKHSSQCLRIQRNWRPDDELQERIVNISHYQLLKGLGFYGLGIYHILGSSIKTLNELLRDLIDGGKYASFSGGFRTQDAKLELVKGRGNLGKDGKIPPPGTWREVQSSPEDLKNAFFPMPTKEPSAVLSNMMTYIDSRAKDAAGAGWAMHGDDKLGNMPVGTILALIEQSNTQYSAIFQRVHNAQTIEFNMMARLISDHIPPEGYPYNAGSGVIMASDFDDRIDILPVSSPDVISKSHRIMQANAIVELATKEPFAGLIDPKWLLEQGFNAMRVEVPQDAWVQPQQSEQEQLALEQMRIENENKAVDTESKKMDMKEKQAKLANTNMDTMFSSVQAAAAAVVNKEILPIAGQLNQSAGLVDENGGTIADYPVGLDATPVMAPANTHPQFPPNPQQPANPDVGINTLASE